jgi:hypothetical protein
VSLQQLLLLAVDFSVPASAATAPEQPLLVAESPYFLGQIVFAPEVVE